MLDLFNNSYDHIRTPYDVMPTTLCCIEAQVSKIGYTDSDYIDGYLHESNICYYFMEQIPPVLTAEYHG